MAAALGRLGVAGGARVVVACSGGPDSSALAHAAIALSAAGRIGPVTLCYVDHRLRPDSAEDGKLVARLAAAGQADFASVAVDVDRERASLEEAARDARYTALARVAEERGASSVLMGHTADDQAETALMRIIAGTGIGGLAGIPERRGLFVRPLLRLGRADAADYCRRQGIETADDPTNRDPAHFRNRVRHQILPALRHENPRVAEALVGLAARAAEVDEAIDFAADALAARSAGEGGTWDVAVLAAGPRLVAARVLARAAAAMGAGPLSSRQHAALDALLRRTRGGTGQLDLAGAAAVREYGVLRFVPSAQGPPSAGTVEVSGPDPPYEVRPARPGDRMRPARLLGRSRKLSDLFIDARVPRRLRPGARVVVRVSDGQIEWAEHIGPAHGSRISVTLTGQGPVATNKAR